MSRIDRVAVVTRELRELAAQWPKDQVWLFAAGGSLHLMRYGVDGKRIYLAAGGVDPSYIIERIDIPCDGGDW